MSTLQSHNENIDKIVEHISDLLRMLIAREGVSAHLHGFINVCLNLTNTFRDDLRIACPLNMCLVSLMVEATSQSLQANQNCCNQLLSDHTPCDGLRLWILGAPNNWSIPSYGSSDLCADYDYNLSADNTNATIYCTNNHTKNWSEEWISAIITILAIFIFLGISGHVMLTAIALFYRKRWKCGNLLFLFILDTGEAVIPLLIIPYSIMDFLTPDTNDQSRQYTKQVATYLSTTLTLLILLLLANGSFLRVLQCHNKCSTSFTHKISAAAITTIVIAMVTRIALFSTEANANQINNLCTETLILLSVCGILVLLCCSYVLYYDAILSHCRPAATNTQIPQKQANGPNRASGQKTLLQNPLPKSHLPPLAPPMSLVANGQDEGKNDKEFEELFTGPTVCTTTSQLNQMFSIKPPDLQVNDQSKYDDFIDPDTNKINRTTGLHTASIEPLQKVDIINTQTTLVLLLALAVGSLPPLLNDHFQSTHQNIPTPNHEQYHRLLWCFAYAIRCLNPWIVVAQHRTVCAQLYKELRKLCQQKVGNHDPS